VKRLIGLLIAASLCLPTSASAWWQSIQQVAVSGGGGGSPALAYIGNVTPTYASNVATATAAPIGTASSGRLVVVVFYDLITPSPGVSTATVTIGGVSAVVNTIASVHNSTVGIASANVPTGTTANIVVSYDTSSGANGAFDVYALTGLSSMTAVGSGETASAGANPITTTLATTAGGIVIAGAQQSGGGGTLTMSGTETYTKDSSFQIASFSSNASSHATGIATNAASSVSATWVSSVGAVAIAAVSFR
jgi:hypothetical protein